MQPDRGDVVRSSGPFKLGTDRQRPWLVVSGDSHPFGDEQYIAVAVSTMEYDDPLALVSGLGDRWRTTRVVRLAVGSSLARAEDLIAWQGRVAEGFVDRVVDELETYLR